MLHLSFHPNDTSVLLANAADDYRGMWKSDGIRIQKAMESATGLLFPDALDSHQLLDLFLYDVWAELFGSQYADEQVAVEKIRSKRYLKCWEWALAIPTNERKQRLATLIELK
jgi:hypothetical protein